MDMPIDYHVWGLCWNICYDLKLQLSKTHAKAGQYHAELKDRFVDDTE